MQVAEREREVDGAQVDVGVPRPPRRQRAASEREGQQVGLHPDRASGATCARASHHRQGTVEGDDRRAQRGRVPPGTRAEVDRETGGPSRAEGLAARRCLGARPCSYSALRVS